MDRQGWQTIMTQRSSLICGQTGLAYSGDSEEQSDLWTDRAGKHWTQRSSLICGLANSVDSEETGLANSGLRGAV